MESRSVFKLRRVSHYSSNIHASASDPSVGHVSYAFCGRGGGK